MGRLRRWVVGQPATVWLGAVAVAFVGITLGPSLIGLRSLISVDLLSAYYPWRASGSLLKGHVTCTGDTIDTVMPSIAYVRNAWLHGGLGAWQGYIGGGSPLGALPNLALLNPLSLPYLILPLWLAPAYVKLAEIIAGGGGTYLFLRRLGVSRPAGMLAGIVFASSGYMVVWSNWPQTRVGALIPPLFWSVERLVQRRRFTDCALVGIVVASMILSGFPAVTAWALEAAGLYFLARVLLPTASDLREKVRTIGLGVLGTVTGALLAMIQLMPFIKSYNDTDAVVRETYGLLPLAASRLLTLVDPNAYGLCVGGEPRYDGSSPVESVAFVGAAALVLAIIGAAVRYRRVSGAGGDAGGPRLRSSVTPRGVTTFFAVVSAAIIVIGWGSSRVLRALQPVPPFAGNPVGRIRALLGFTLAVLAGFGFDAVLAGRRQGRREAHQRSAVPRWVRPAVVVAVAVLGGAAVVYRARQSALDVGFWPALRGTLLVPGLILLATLVVLALALTGQRHLRVLAVITLPLLVVGQSAFFFHRVLPGDSTGEFYPRTGTHQFLAGALGSQRYDATDMVMYPSTSLYYGLRAATGHATQTKAWVDLLHTADPQVSLTPTFTAFSAAMTPDKVANSPILDRLGIEYWVFGPDVVTGSQPELPSTAGSVALPSAAGTVSCSVAGGPIRGIIVRLASAMQPLRPTGAATLHVVARNGDRTVSSAHAVAATRAAGSIVPIAVAGEQLGAGPTTVTLSVSGAAGAVSVTGTGGAASCGTVRPANDHLRLAYADAGSVVYQRLSALDRIRWSGNAEVISDPAAQLTALAQGVPSDTVVLGSPSGTPSGKGATLSVTHDSGGHVTAHVDAQGSGYLTVADAMTADGWSVTVDGRAASLLVGDHGLATVAVPAGAHTVDFRYWPPGFSTGLVLTGVGGVLLVLLIVLDVRRRRRSPGQVTGAGSGSG